MGSKRGWDLCGVTSLAWLMLDATPLRFVDPCFLVISLVLRLSWLEIKELALQGFMTQVA